MIARIAEEKQLTQGLMPRGELEAAYHGVVVPCEQLLPAALRGVMAPHDDKLLGVRS